MENSDNTRVISHGELEGYVRIDCFGRLFIDRCESDHIHLTTPRGIPDAERPGCRKYFDSLLVPEDLLGKKMNVRYEVRITLIPET